MTKIEKPLPIIRVRNLHKTFGSNHVLQGVNLDVYPGESFVVIGGSGSGKSVFLKCVLGLLEPDSGGEIEIAGVDVLNGSAADVEKARRKVSMLFQGNALFDSLPVWENICFLLLQTKRIDRKEAYVLSQKILPTVGLKKDVADLSPAELSGGMQRRVALARAIASKPEIIFFDEPTTGLDPIMASIIDDLIVKSVKEVGATAVSITHNMSSARRIADRIAMLYQGKLIWIGGKDELDNNKNPFVQQFIKGLIAGPIKLET